MISLDIFVFIMWTYRVVEFLIEKYPYTKNPGTESLKELESLSLFSGINNHNR